MSKSRVKTGGCMALGQYKTVSSRILGILGINVHFFKIKIGKYICSGKRSAGMAGLGTVYTGNDAFSYLNGHLLKF
jgi:hypothetical protein